ncbi:MAG: PIN domain-containing protein [Patescibacteria group bacterium]
MNVSHAIYLDTSFFKALLDSKDDFHNQAKIQWDLFRQQDTELVTTNYIIDESLTLIRFRCGFPVAKKLRDLLYENAEYIKIIRVMVDDDAGAWEWFEMDWSKLSFTDCVSFAVMKRLGLTDVATFDEHFTRAKFIVHPTRS